MSEEARLVKAAAFYSEVLTPLSIVIAIQVSLLLHLDRKGEYINGWIVLTLFSFILLVYCFTSVARLKFLPELTVGFAPEEEDERLLMSRDVKVTYLGIGLDIIITALLLFVDFFQLE